jgi:DNA repair protein RadD
MITLRPYQYQAVEDVRDCFRSGIKKALLCIPTGGGKTIIFSYMAAETLKKAYNVTILVHRDSLFKQTSKTLQKFGIDHGLIGSGYTPTYSKSAQVAKVGTLVNRLDKIKPRLIIVDEAHHATAGQYKKILEAYPDAYILGVTATPCRTDGTGLGTIFDKLIIGPTIQELIDLGYLVEPRIFAPPSGVDWGSVKTTGGDYNQGALNEIMDKPVITGDAVKHYTRICAGVPAVAFCVSIKHAQHVAESFALAGYKTACVHGKMEQKDIDQILDGLGNGTFEVVTSCNLISEGTDIPAIGCAILLRPTMSLSLYLQQVGRALRLFEGKTESIILDHVGNVMRHGHPCDDREWSLEGTKKKKRTTDMETPVTIKECEYCYNVYYATLAACPSCGTVPVIKERQLEIVDGELEELKRAELEEKKEKQREVGRARTLEELKKIEKERGYKSGWAWNRFNSRK